jgi:hypothetical protein
MGAHTKSEDRQVRRPGGRSIDADFYRDRAAQARSLFLRALFRRAVAQASARHPRDIQGRSHMAG